MHEDLVDRIYEAALVPELWPDVLDTLSAMTGSIGGAVLTAGDRHPPRWAASKVVAPALHAFATSDAWKHNKRPVRWLSSTHSGFLREVDLFTVEELQGDPMFDELKASGLGWQLGAVIPMATGESWFSVWNVALAMARTKFRCAISSTRFVRILHELACWRRAWGWSAQGLR